MRYDVRPAASGGWLALAAGPRLLVLPGLDDPAAALASLAGADGFRRAVDLLAAGGLTAMPSFVLVDTSGESRIIVRGELDVTIEDAAGERSIDATTVSTWVEQLVPGLRSVAVSVPGASEAIARDLPFHGGVAFAAAVRAVVEDGAEAPAEAIDAPRVESVVPPAVVTAVAAAAEADPDVEPAVEPEPELEADDADDTGDPDDTDDTDEPAPPVAADRIDAPPPVDHEVDPHATVIGPFDSAPPSAAPDAPAPAAATASDPDTETPTDGDGYDYLFGETVYRSVAEAAVPEAADDEAAEAAVPASISATTAELAGDHDGETVLTSDIAKLRGDRPRTATPPPAPAAAVVPSVILPNGSRERLDQPIIVGRSPSASQVTAGSIPKLVTIGSGDQDISRSHVRLALEGGTVVVTDLHSVNGTSVVLPGREPQRLRAGDSTAVIPGTIVDLGGGVTLTVVED